MRNTRWLRWTGFTLSACLLGMGAFQGCGGGGGVPAGGVTVVDGPGGTLPPPTTPPPGGAGANPPAGTGTDGGGGAPPDDPGNGLPVVPGPAPGPRVLAKLSDVRAVATAETGAIYAVDGGGRLWSMLADDLDPTPLYDLGLRGIEGLAYVDAGPALLLSIEGGVLARLDLPSMTVYSMGVISGYRDVRALEFDGRTMRLYGVDAPSRTLLEIRMASPPAPPPPAPQPPPTLLAPIVLGVLPAAYSAVEGLALDMFTRSLYATDDATQSLLEVSVADAQVTVRARLPRRGIRGLGYVSTGDRFVVADASAGELLLWDAKGHDIDYGSMGGLDYDVVGRRLLGVHQGQAMLVSIDPGTGWKAWVGWIGVGGIESLAVDAARGTAYGVDNGRDVLVRISLLDGKGADVGPLAGVTGAGSDVAGLTYDSRQDVLYGIAMATGSLLRIDPASGVTAPVATLPFGGVRSLAYEPERGLLHGFDDQVRMHLSIDPASGVAFVEALPLMGPIGGLGYDVRSRILWGTQPSSASLVVVWRADGPGLGFGEVRAVARMGATLLGFDQATNCLISIDPSTGAGQVVAVLSDFSIEALAFDPSEGPQGMLYASDARSGYLLRVDPLSWQVSGVGKMLVGAGPAVRDVTGLAFTSGGVLFGVDRANRKLIHVDAATGATTVRADLTGYGLTDLEDLTFDVATQRLIAVDAAQRRLVEIDPSDSAVTQIGVMEPLDVRALAMGDDRVLHVFDVDTDRMLKVDRFTGVRLP